MFFAGERRIRQFAMTTFLPNPSIAIPLPKSFFSHSFPRSISITGGEKSVFVPSSFYPCQRGECGISFALTRRRKIASAGGAIISDEVKEILNDDKEEGEEFLPSRQMARWLQDKPVGFGEGKKYDTTVEEKLMEEIERSRKDQLKKKKTGAKAKVNTGSDRKQEKQEAVDVIQIGTQVRIWNLPKKKNIDRDLWKAFKEFPGIIAVNPAVTGNEKTRDPICKGFAFIVLKSDDAAYRFVQKYSKQNLLFGRVQKQICCDVVGAHPSIKSPESNKHISSSSLQEGGMSMPYELEVSKSSNTIPSDEQVTQELAVGNWSTSCPGFPEAGNEIPQPLIPMRRHQNPENMVKKRKKEKQRKASKLQTIGSLARLKIKERAVLTNVFSKYKYGEIASIESKES